MQLISYQGIQRTITGQYCLKLNDILKYLKRSNFDIFYRYMNNLKRHVSEVSIWSNALFLNDLTTRKSTIRYFVFWNKYTVSWSSFKTKKATLRTPKSEFVAAANALKAALYLKNINQEVLLYKCSMKLCEDSRNCTKQLKNATAYQAKTKHINIRHHFIHKSNVQLKFYGFNLCFRQIISSQIF